MSGKKSTYYFLLLLLSLSIQSCNGVLDGIYDTPEIGKNSILVDCADYDRWWYVDLHALKDSTVKNPDYKATLEYRMIPTVLNGTWDGKSGVYKYSYEVGTGGRGIEYNTFISMTQADPQSDPDQWDLAFHYNNVRTNGGAAYETSITSMDGVNSAADFQSMPFREDEWDETHVWIDRSEMLLTFVYNQGIRINKVLGSWLTLDIPPYPPAFNYNPHVYIVRLKDGTMAALRLANYMDAKGNKCHLTIEYKYPLQ